MAQYHGSVEGRYRLRSRTAFSASGRSSVRHHGRTSQTDLEVGAIVTLNQSAHGTRDPILYHQHLRPQVYIPIHQTDATPISSALRYKISYEKTLVAANVAVRPEVHWKTDPDDFLKIEAFDSQDSRWKKQGGNHQAINQFCGH